MKAPRTSGVAHVLFRVVFRDRLVGQEKTDTATERVEKCGTDGQDREGKNESSVHATAEWGKSPVHALKSFFSGDAEKKEGGKTLISHICKRSISTLGPEVDLK